MTLIEDRNLFVKGLLNRGFDCKEEAGLFGRRIVATPNLHAYTYAGCGIVDISIESIQNIYLQIQVSSNDRILLTLLVNNYSDDILKLFKRVS